MNNKDIGIVDHINEQTNLYKNSTQSLWYMIVMYVCPSDALLLSLGVNEYYYICHNRDVNSEGELLKEHYHLIIKLKKKTTPSGVFSIINSVQNGCTQPHLIKQVANIPLSIRYLIHADNKDKFQYMLEMIVTNKDVREYFDLKFDTRNIINDIITQISYGELSTLLDCYRYAYNYGAENVVMRNAYFIKELLKENFSKK